MRDPTIDITRASLADAEEILALQKLAYQSEAERYQDFAIPPLLQTADEMREDLRKQVVCKAVRAGTIVACARAYQEGDTAFMARVIVHKTSSLMLTSGASRSRCAARRGVSCRVNSDRPRSRIRRAAARRCEAASRHR